MTTNDLKHAATPAGAGFAANPPTNTTTAVDAAAPMSGTFKRALAGALLAVAACFALLLGGCSDSGDAAGGEADKGGEASNHAAVLAAIADVDAMDFDCTDRDRDGSWDASSATAIDLDTRQISPAGATEAGSEGASADDATGSAEGASADDTAGSSEGASAGAAFNETGDALTITAAGTYVLKGTWDQGTVEVSLPDDEAHAEDKVQLVLAGASIHNEHGPALQVKQADKVFVTLAEGSANKLSDGAAYTLAEGSDEPHACLFSADDLTINGSGSLEVVGAYRHAIASKDDLAITGGTVKAKANEDGLRGNDAVKLAGGNIEVEAKGDGVKSNNAEAADRGFVTIDGAELKVVAGDDGIDAASCIRMTSGKADVTAEDDALHTDGICMIEGGAARIDAKDDAIHAEYELRVNDGEVRVDSCNEGYEAEQVYLNGGASYVVASDDAVNASAADANGFAEAGADCAIVVNGGFHWFDAKGDGIDSNGSFEMNDGVVLVAGPDNGGNGAFDCAGSAQVNGGTALMVGDAGMAQGFTGGNQAFGQVRVSGKAGDSIALLDAEGKVTASMTAPRAFGHVVVTAASLQDGTEARLVVGGTVADADSVGYASGTAVEGGEETSFTATTSGTQGAGQGMGGPGGPNGPDANQGMGGPGRPEPPAASPNGTQPPEPPAASPNDDESAERAAGSMQGLRSDEQVV